MSRHTPFQGRFHPMSSSGRVRTPIRHELNVNGQFANPRRLDFDAEDFSPVKQIFLERVLKWTMSLSRSSLHFSNQMCCPNSKRMRVCTKFINNFLVKHLIIVSLVLAVAIGIWTSGATIRSDRLEGDFIPLQKPYDLQENDRLILSSSMPSVQYIAIVEKVQPKARRVSIRYDDCWIACVKLISINSEIILYAYRLHEALEAAAPNNTSSYSSEPAKLDDDDDDDNVTTTSQRIAELSSPLHVNDVVDSNTSPDLLSSYSNLTANFLEISDKLKLALHTHQIEHQTAVSLLQNEIDELKADLGNAKVASPSNMSVFATIDHVEQVENQMRQVFEIENGMQADIANLSASAAEQSEKHDSVCLRVTELEKFRRDTKLQLIDLAAKTKVQQEDQPNKHDSVSSHTTLVCDCAEELEAVTASTRTEIESRFANASLISDDVRSQLDGLSIQMNASALQERLITRSISNLRANVDERLAKVDSKLQRWETNIPDTSTLQSNWNEELQAALTPLENRITNVSSFSRSNMSKLDAKMTSKVASVTDRLDALTDDLIKLQQQLDKFQFLVREQKETLSGLSSLQATEMTTKSVEMEKRLLSSEQSVSSLKRELQTQLKQISSKLDEVSAIVVEQEKTTGKLISKTNDLESKVKDGLTGSVSDSKDFLRWAATQDFDALNPKPDWASAVVEHSSLMTASIFETIASFFDLRVRGRFNQQALKPTHRNGQCTPLRGDKGFIVVKLFRPIRVTALALYHRDKSMLPIQASAPHKFEAYGKSLDSAWYKIGYFSYEKKGAQRLQTFFVHDKSIFSHVKLQFLSNWGAAYTCIYRIRVHGKRITE